MTMVRRLLLLVLSAALTCVAVAPLEEDASRSFRLWKRDFVHEAKQFTEITQVDFKNWTYSSEGILEYPEGGPVRIQPLTLTDGKYSWRGPEGFGFEDASLASVEYFSDESLSSPIAIVNLSYVYGGGSSNCVGVVQFFQIKDARVVLLYEITYDCHGRSWFEFHQDKKELEVGSVGYMHADAHCCPSKIDVGRFSLAAGALRLISWERIDYDENAGPGKQRREKPKE